MRMLGLRPGRILKKSLRIINGVVSVHMPEDKSHMIVIEYDPDKTSSKHLLAIVQELAGHAELIGL
jgi:hypothetical protein